MKSILGAIIALRVVVKLVKGYIREPVTLTKTYRIQLTPDVFVAIGMDKHVSQLIWSAWWLIQRLMAAWMWRWKTVKYSGLEGLYKLQPAIHSRRCNNRNGRWPQRNRSYGHCRGFSHINSQWLRLAQTHIHKTCTSPTEDKSERVGHEVLSLKLPDLIVQVLSTRFAIFNGLLIVEVCSSSESEKCVATILLAQSICRVYVVYSNTSIASVRQRRVQSQ